MGDVMLFGILRMPYDMAMANEISHHQYWQSGRQAADEIERLQQTVSMLSGDRDLYIEEIKLKNAEIERLREALQKAGAAVERLAFKMPPPNVWTPQFVQLGQQIARSALQQKDSE